MAPLARGRSCRSDRHGVVGIVHISWVVAGPRHGRVHFAGGPWPCTCALRLCLRRRMAVGGGPGLASGGGLPCGPCGRRTGGG
eukprot:6873670-Prymnesium_polylepis.1